MEENRVGKWKEKKTCMKKIERKMKMGKKMERKRYVGEESDKGI